MTGYWERRRRRRTTDAALMLADWQTNQIDLVIKVNGRYVRTYKIDAFRLTSEMAPGLAAVGRTEYIVDIPVEIVIDRG